MHFERSPLHGAEEEGIGQEEQAQQGARNGAHGVK